MVKFFDVLLAELIAVFYLDSRLPNFLSTITWI